MAVSIRKVSVIVTLSLALLIIAIAFLIDYLYKEKLDQIIRKEINSQVSVKIYIADIDVSVFRKFPDITITLHYVFANNPPGFQNIKSSGRIFFFEKIFLEFNLIDFFNGRYIVNSIHADKGYIDVIVNDKGKLNYDVITESSGNEMIKIDLQAVKITRADLFYHNPLKKIRINAHTNKTNLDAIIINENFDSNINGDLFVKYIRYGKITYVKSRAMHIKGFLKSDNKIVDVVHSEITLSGLTFAMSGIIPLYQNQPIDLKIEGKNLDMLSFIALLPPEYTKDISHLKSTGTLYFNSFINGLISTSINPEVKVFFGVKNGSVINTKTGLALKDLYAEGIFSNGANRKPESSYLQLKNLSGKYKSSYLSGYLEVRDFTNPSVFFTGNANLNLDELNKLKFTREYTGLNEISGKLTADLNLKLAFSLTDSFTVKKVIPVYINGKALLSNVSLKANELPVNVSNLTGRIIFEDYIQLEKFRVNINNNSFLIDGRLNSKITEILDKKSVLSFTGSVYSPRIIVDNFDKINSQPEPKSKVSNQFALPQNITIDVRFFTDSLIYKNLRAGKVKCRVFYQPSGFDISALSFTLKDGEIKGNWKIIPDAGKSYIIAGDAEFKKIDISYLLKSFDNFGQQTIMSDNIGGMASGNIRLHSEWSSDFKLRTEKIKAESNLTIENGELIQFEPMLKLSRFIDVSELGHVKFSTLSNTFYINDGALQFPQMDIYSSALNLQASGIHRFDNNFTYHVRVYLSDLLSRKNKKRKEFEEFEDKKFGRFIIPLLITGNIDNYKVSYDRKEAMLIFKENFNQSRDEISSFINQEIQTINTPETTDTFTHESFRISWEAAQDTIIINSVPENKNKKPAKNSDDKVKSEGFKVTFDDDN